MSFTSYLTTHSFMCLQDVYFHTLISEGGSHSCEWPWHALSAVVVRLIFFRKHLAIDCSFLRKHQAIDCPFLFFLMASLPKPHSKMCFLCSESCGGMCGMCERPVCRKCAPGHPCTSNDGQTFSSSSALQPNQIHCGVIEGHDGTELWVARCLAVMFRVMR